jgi:hypothetical protein
MQRRKSELDKPISQLADQLDLDSTKDEDYERYLGRLERLTKLRKSEARDGVSWDTIISTGGSVVCVLIVVGFERSHVWVSKATGFIRGFK